MTRIFPLIFSILVFVSFSCQESSPTKKQSRPSDYQEELLEANKRVVKTEAQHIADFLSRYKWEMTESGSGLHYMIYSEGNGLQAEKGLLASLNYSVKLITGDQVYNSDETGPLSFIIGNGEVISGLEEGILFMKVGDKAKFIIPSHLAYGLVGDGKQIPAKSTLIYDVELINLIQSN